MSAPSVNSGLESRLYESGTPRPVFAPPPEVEGPVPVVYFTDANFGTGVASDVVSLLQIGGEIPPVFVPVTDEELVAAIDAHPDVEGWMARQDVLVSIGGHNYRSFGVDGDLDRVPLAVVEGRHFEGPNEAIIGLGLARSLDLKVGDERLVRFFNDRGPSRVTIASEEIVLRIHDASIIELSVRRSSWASDVQAGRCLQRTSDSGRRRIHHGIPTSPAPRYEKNASAAC